MTRSSRHALVAFLVATLACCTSWGRSGPFSSDLLAKRPSRLRVTLTDGRRFELLRPAARGDTLVGDTLASRGYDNYFRQHVAVPFAAVASVSERRYSGGRTALLGVGIVAGIAGVTALVLEGISNSVMSGGLGGGAGCKEMPDE